jgi:hypothetical protein
MTRGLSPNLPFLPKSLPTLSIILIVWLRPWWVSSVPSFKLVGETQNGIAPFGLGDERFLTVGGSEFDPNWLVLDKNVNASIAPLND